ncbi:hypothetical protein AAMO2058_000645000 [Amorphochlora amoebiformis]|mmetsp:Transcript_1904/g.2635  ORF Transcript_1904/g.2635 Transcript_1904/m.2635 type:complete len:624 (-) Transcript_1904:103-1974(-)
MDSKTLEGGDSLHSSLQSTPAPPACLIDIDIPRLKLELRQATRELSERGLYHAAKWAGELVSEINEGSQSDEDEDEDEDEDDDFGQDRKKPSRMRKETPNPKPKPVARRLIDPVEESDAESDSVALAKTYFDLREYARAARTLRKYNGPRALFLRCYAMYLAGEKTKVEEMQQKRDSLARAKVTNRALTELERELGKLYKKEEKKEKARDSKSAPECNSPGLDPFCMYLYGLVLKQLDRHNLAIQVIVDSVNAYPYNWSAWRCLTSLIKTKDSVTNLALKDNCFKQMFLADVYLELQHHESNEVLVILEALQDVFEDSTHLLAQLALARYNMREFDEAQRLLQILHEADPCRLTTMDVYSNILFVKESKAELSFLAHTAIKIDKYRPETCCIIGNYYSLKREHERAVLYFKRALRLDPNYLSAWTLMGHEYVEMRNSAAAIESYRRAVDINPRDYRAWYGLGQTYEIMRMHNYALYYFGKATKLRPYDPRMWCAMGETFEKLGRYEDAIKCYKQAEGNEDPEGTAILKLAVAYQKINDQDTAASYFRKVLKRRENETSGSEERRDNADALIFLARYCKRKGFFVECERYCNRLLDIGGTVKDEAKSILVDVREATTARERRFK